ncbi:lipid A export permease/ATP-binding protein MsbA [Rhodoferax sp. OV413]|uniref:lipid A export permease/ATP-binding protein MsbA n=1 Tax=Rhodoferax sp. OV413 TaxID=1855285 RepID=UPI0025F05DAA|nr:lipid A export permease/ATP-binding protein MsbA [Rhodoferax sp. OV413]
MKDSFLLYRRLFASIRPYRGVVGLSVLAMVAAAALEPVLPALLKPLIDENLIGKNVESQWHVPVLMMLAFTLKGVAEYVANVASQWVANKAVTDLRQQVFAHQMHLPLSDHLEQTPGRMMSRILYDIPQVGAALSTAWIVVIRDSLIVIGLTGYLLWTAWELTLLIVAVAPFAAWLIKVASGKLRGGNQAMQESTGVMTGSIEESLNGVREIKLFGTHAHEAQRFGRITEELRRQTMRTVRISALNVPLVQVLASVAVAAVIWVATSLSAQQKLSPGEFVAFVAAMSMIFEPIRRLTNINDVIQRGLAGAQSLFELLDMQPEPDSGVAQMGRARGHLRFEGVSFRYPGQESWALQDVSFELKPGETVALVGASGSGKSTLVNLAARFFECTKGQITLDGRALAAIELVALRQQLGWVGQHVVLFDDSVAANIAYGSPQTDESAIMAAAKAANAWEFIQEMPGGLAAGVGSNGGQLSGGQRQRIAIARAFLKDAPILLLDEATSALDNASERAVQESLALLRQNRSVLVVAHRLSTIRHADRIVVMDQGRVVEQGDHDTLMQMGGFYARLLASGAGTLSS